MSTYDKASLVLIPSGTKEGVVFSQKPTNGDGDFTFSRSTAATRVNADGLIEKETQNLLLQSNSFDTTWVLNNGATLTSGQTGYDGSTDAWLLTKPASGFTNVAQLFSTSGIVTFSVYAKAGTISTFNLRMIGTDEDVLFDLSAGSVSTSTSGVIDSKITAISSGWYRCSFSAIYGSGTQVGIYVGDVPDTTAGNIYIQDAQLEEGLVARDYIETTTTAVYGGITDNVPRLDYTDSSCPALLLEGQRTNLMVQSEGFSTSDWTDNKTSNTNVTANAAISPEGVQNATEIDFTTTGGAEILDKFTNVASSTHIASCWFKNGTIGQIFFELVGGTPNILAQATINLSTGVLTDQVGSFTPTIEDYGNGWYRVAIGDLGNASIASPSFKIKQSGSNTGTFYVWGAQCEAGSYPTSYIPTYGTSVTRVAENNAILDATNLIGQTEGTIYWEGVINGLDNAFGNIVTSERNIVNAFSVLANKSSSGFQCAVFDNGVKGQCFGGSLVFGQKHKLAYAYKSGDFALYVDGSLVATSTDTWNPVGTIDELYLGDSITFFGYKEGNRYDNTIIFPTRLSNEEAIALTTI